MQQPRYRANFPELFFKARSELPPGTVLMQISLPFLRLSRGPRRLSKILKTLAGIVPFRPRSRAFTFWRPGLFLAVRSLVRCLCHLQHLAYPRIHPSRALVLATLHCPLAVRLSRTWQELLFHWWIALDEYWTVVANS